jgi:hypothetical protein
MRGDLKYFAILWSIAVTVAIIIRYLPVPRWGIGLTLGVSVRAIPFTTLLSWLIVLIAFALTLAKFVTWHRH